jgi:hypothetical protein
VTTAACPSAPCDWCFGVRLALLGNGQPGAQLCCPVCFRMHSVMARFDGTEEPSPEPSERRWGPAEIRAMQLANKRRAERCLIATCKQRRRARIRGSRRA